MLHTILDKINKTPIRLKIALSLGITEQGVIKAIKQRRGTLLKKTVIDIVAEEMNMSIADTYQILKKLIDEKKSVNSSEII